jgi:hypothetical protein
VKYQDFKAGLLLQRLDPSCVKPKPPTRGDGEDAEVNEWEVYDEAFRQSSKSKNIKIGKRF